MMSDGPSGDDKRILDELEAFQRAIGAARGRGGPDAGGPVIRPAPVVATPGPRADAVPPEQWTAPAAPDRVAAPPDAAGDSHGVHPMFGADEAAATARWWRTSRVVWVAGVALALIALIWMGGRTPDVAPEAESAPSTAVPSTSPPPAPPVATPEPSPVEPHRLRIDLATSRTVWLRVTVDGRIALERELGPGERLPFGADRSIVIRAGDAGAVSVTVGGVEQGPLGADGKVLTRRFDAEPK